MKYLTWLIAVWLCACIHAPPMVEPLNSGEPLHSGEANNPLVTILMVNIGCFPNYSIDFPVRPGTIYQG